MRKTFTDRGPSVSQSTEISGKYGTAAEQAQGYRKLSSEMYDPDSPDWPQWDDANEEMIRPFGHGGFLPRGSYRER